MNVEIIRKFIEENHIKAMIIQHEKSGLTSKDASAVNCVNLSDIIKTLLFIGKNKNVIVICLGSNKISMKKLESHGIKKPHIANEIELKKLLDSSPGGVPPIGLPENIEKLLDKRVMEKQIVIGSAGSEFAGLKIAPSDILKYSNAKVADIVE